jgi:pimeloyl-ACP methyl ester carboxylesterase
VGNIHTQASPRGASARLNPRSAGMNRRRSRAAGASRHLRVASSSQFARLTLGFPALVCGLLLFAIPAAADVVIMKDGFTLHGKIIKEQTAIRDPDHGPIFTIKGNGLTSVDDGARWMVFPASQRQLGDVSKDYDKFAGNEVFLLKTSRIDSLPLPGSALFRKATEFDKNWRRVMTFDDPNGGFYEIKQQITALTPHQVRIEAITHIWTSFHLTKELGPELCKTLIRNHPDMIEKDRKPDPDKRMRLVRFLMQAEWWDEAEKEGDELVRLVPEAKERVEKVHEEIRGLRNDLLLSEIERAKDAGRHTWAREALKRFPQQNVPAKMIARVATLLAEYDAQFKQHDSAKRLLKDLIPQVQDAVLLEAAKAVDAELHPDTVGRVENFVTLAEQAEQFAKQGRKVLHTPDELLASAITGWLLGKNSAETRPSSAQKFWQIRQMVLEYQRTDGVIARRNLLAKFQKTSIPLEFDELAQLISLLPPCEADDDLPAKAQTRKSGSLPGLREGVEYLVQLPPEYQPGRAYPLLVILPDGGQKPEDLLLKGFGDLPARNGYIVAALNWHRGIRDKFDPYNADDQHMVTGLVWHLRRKFQVDSDRVFLFGYGEGANIALDVGSAHPDLFAGVVPMGPFPYWWFVNDYWRNMQHLPLYLITGDQVGDRVRPIRRVLDSIMSKGYPAIAVSYKGRSYEWFGFELPYAFDWMNRKRRETAVPELGKPGLASSDGEEYRTLRATDDRFYWLSTKEISPQNLLVTFLGTKKTPNAARLQGSILAGNTIHVKTVGVKDVTVWLGKGMVDFSLPIRIKVNNDDYWTNDRKLVKPNLSVLLEDLYERGDRQRPFFEKVTRETRQ